MAELDWRGSAEFRFGEIDYVCWPLRAEEASTARRFMLRKDRAGVEDFVCLLAAHRPRNIVELGMFDGASAVLFTQLAEPERLITFDRADKARPALEEFIANHPLGRRISPHRGVDQADRESLRRIMDDELPGQQLDLVVDDASHRLAPTRASFNELFPRLRAGGKFVIEDWAWTHKVVDDLGAASLAALIFELTLVLAQAPQVVAQVEVAENWVVVTRGESEWDPEIFDLSLFVRADKRGILPSTKVQPNPRTAPKTESG